MPLSTGTQDQENTWLTDLSKVFIQPESEMETETGAVNETPRGTGLLQIPGNAVHNIGDITQGLSVAGTIVGSRLFESFPSVGDDGSFQLGQSPVRFTDLDEIGKTVDAVFNSYKKNYVDPVLEGRIEDIAKYAARHPVDFGLDALSVAAPFKNVAKAAGVTDKLAQGVEKVGETGKMIAGKVEQAVMANDDLAPVLERLQAKAEGYNIRSARDKALAEDLKKTLPEMQRLYEAVPPAYRPLMRDILEGRHPEVLLNGYGRLPAEVNAFREAVQAFTEKRLAQLKELGIVKDEIAFADRFKPMLSEYLNTVKGAKNVDVNKLPKEQVARLIQEVSEYAKSKGINPVYQMRGSDSQIGKILTDPLSTPTWMHKLMKNRATGETVEGFGQEIERSLVNNEAVAQDALKVSMASDIQTAQAYHTYKAFMETVAQKAIPVSKLTAKEQQMLAKGELAVFDPAQFFGVTDVFDAQTLRNVFPEAVAIPWKVLQGLNHLTSWKKGSFEKLLAGFANFARRYVLGYNMLFPEKQQLQNWFMLGMTQFNGPRDTMLSLLSYAMANDKNVTKHIPAALMAEQFGAEATAAKTVFGKAQKAFEAIPDFTFARAQIYDRYTRAAAAIYYGLKVSETDAQLGKIVTGLVDSGEAINRMNKAFQTPEMYAKVAKQIETTLGDYSALKSSQRAGIRSLLLWWLWYEHIVKFTASLLDTNPYKMSLMHAITRVYPEMYQQEVPEGQLREAGAIMLPGRENGQGMPMATMSGGFNPFATVGELVEMTSQPFQAKAASSFLGASNPLFTIAAFLFGTNPQTGTGFRDPNLISLGGRQYRPEDVAMGRLIEQKPSPDKLEYIMRTFFPAPTRTAERIFEKISSGGESSQFTAVAALNSAPRRKFGAHGAPLEAQSLFDIILQSIIGQRAFPIDTESARRMMLLEHKRLAQAYRAMMLQHGGSPY